MTSVTPKFREIVVGLTSGGYNEGTIAISVRLAATIRCTVKGVFVDEDIFRELAGFSFAKAQSPTSNTPLPITTESMTQAVEHKAVSSRKILEQQAVRLDLQWSFERKKGDLAQIVGGHVSEKAIVVFPRDRFLHEPKRLASTVRTVRAGGSNVIFVAEGWQPTLDAPLLLLVQPGAGSRSAIVFATEFAEHNNLALYTAHFASDEQLAPDKDDDDPLSQDAELTSSGHYLGSLYTDGLEEISNKLSPALTVVCLNSINMSNDRLIYKFLKTMRSPVFLFKPDAKEQ